MVKRQFREEEGFGTGLLAGLIGSVIYTPACFFLGKATLAALIDGLVWFLTLGSPYSVGGVKALVVVVWIVVLRRV